VGLDPGERSEPTLAGNVLGSEGTHAHTTEAFLPSVGGDCQGRFLCAAFLGRGLDEPNTRGGTVGDEGSSDRPSCPSVWCCSSNIAQQTVAGYWRSKWHGAY
jgi:hypothetical protein